MFAFPVNIHRTNLPRLFNDPGFAFCAGTLIKKNYILSAAHCFYPLNQSLPWNYFALIGAQYINDTEASRIPIKSIRIHENYDHDLYLNDIAILELSSPVDLNYSHVGLICLPLRNILIYPYEQTESIVAGWGSLLENNSMSYTLQQIQLPVWSNKDEICLEELSDKRTQFCAGLVQGGGDACQGDR